MVQKIAKHLLGLIGCAVFCASLPVCGEDLSLASASLRYAFDDGGTEDFETYELVASSSPVWAWWAGEETLLAARLEGSLGTLRGDHESSPFVGLVPILEMVRTGFPLTLAVGVGPTVFSDQRVDSLDLGGALNFTSSIRLGWWINRHLRVGYQYQHTSNAGIYDENDGIDMHALSIGYGFR
jgi:lipid A 3-O-deacylase